MQGQTGIVGHGAEDQSFLFTDIAGSTQLWERHPIAMRAALARHDTLLREAAAACQGHVFKTIGDAFCVAFGTAEQAVSAAMYAQQSLHGEDWGAVGAIRVRMAVHCGDAEMRDNDYFGTPLNRVARLRDAGHGGQILVTEAIHRHLSGQPLVFAGAEITFHDLGEHRLKDIGEPERIYQISVPGLPDRFDDLRTESTHPHNLPAAKTSFVGRQEELRAIGALLGKSHVRLLTLTGSPGTGKSRLALEVGEEVLRHYRDGVWFADFAALSDPDLVMPTLARLLGIEEDLQKTPRQQIIEKFRSARALLILNDFDRVEDAADELPFLLEGCASLKILLTSRQLLQLSMEFEYAIPPLNRAEGVALFVARAQQAQPDFVLDDTNRRPVEAICTRLDGIPLAVELAAAQVRQLTPDEIEQSLDRRLQVLNTRMRDLPLRHRSLRGAIDWSYDLLSETERDVFNTLSLFVGGFTEEAAEALCVSLHGDAAVAEILAALSGKSLLRVTASPPPNNPAKMGRYVLLESLREYGAEHLEETAGADAIAALRNRHASYFLTFAEGLESKLRGAEQKTAAAALEADMFNLRAGMDYTFETAANDEAARYGVALRRFWNLRGMVREGQDRLQRAAQKVTSIADSRLRIQLLLALGALYLAGGSLDRAFRAYEEMLAASEAAKDPASIGQALQGLGTVMLSKGNLDAADGYLERAVAAKRQAGTDPKGLYTTLNSLGWLAQERGDYPLAQQHFTECLALLEQAGDHAIIAAVLNHLGVVATARGVLDEAREAFQRACDLSAETGNIHAEAYALINLGGLAIQQADISEADLCYSRALAIIQPIEDKPAIAACLIGLGRVRARNTATRSEAVAYAREGFALFRETDNRRSIAEALEALAEIALACSRPEAAGQFLSGAEWLRKATKANRTPYEAERFAETARRAGFDPVPSSDAPDFVLLETVAQTLA